MLPRGFFWLTADLGVHVRWIQAGYRHRSDFVCRAAGPGRRCATGRLQYAAGSAVTKVAEGEAARRRTARMGPGP